MYEFHTWKCIVTEAIGVIKKVLILYSDICSFSVNLQMHYHSMAIANLKKIEELMTNTTAASKYIPWRPRISSIEITPFSPKFT